MLVAIACVAGPAIRATGGKIKATRPPETASARRVAAAAAGRVPARASAVALTGALRFDAGSQVLRHLQPVDRTRQACVAEAKTAVPAVVAGQLVAHRSLDQGCRLNVHRDVGAGLEEEVGRVAVAAARPFLQAGAQTGSPKPAAFIPVPVCSVCSLVNTST